MYSYPTGESLDGLITHTCVTSRPFAPPVLLWRLAPPW